MVGLLLKSPHENLRRHFQDKRHTSPEKMSVVTGNFWDMENLQGFDGLSALEESAVRLHEIYKSLMTGGFTEDEALSLIAKMTKSGPNP